MATKTDLSTYKFNHSMIRVKDPKESVKFYEFLGMSVVRKAEFPEAKFDLYFLGYNNKGAVSFGNSAIDREGVIELTHNYGTENDPTYTINNGNKDPHRGFGHTCISVDNIQAACQRIEDAGYKFQKKLTDGRMHNIAFALDPDGYWVEIIGQKPVEETASIKETDASTYRMNHTMIRVKDQQKSLKFYQEVLGMSLFRTSEAPSAGFNLYFLGYPGTQGVPQDGRTSDREGLLELTWNYGTEKDENFSYHNGNDEPQGFGHICVSVDDLDAACQRFEDLKCNWKKRLTDGRMRTVAFLLDPDGYWVEIVQNDRDLEVFATNEEIRYAILSHTWGTQEVTFVDLLENERRGDLEGWKKIHRSCEIAAGLGFDYIWIDTCCIDKTSSAELSEAINSMFMWYEKAEICIAYLEDVSSADDPTKDTSQIAQCRWFSRGWTLQELIAPPELLFYSQDWELIGTRTSLKDVITKVFFIPDVMLTAHALGQRHNLDGFSVAEKMSWAASRQTTRPEDMAYCLLGLFDINMPLLYGEGRVKAFKRLQEEIIKSTNDDSIYAWSYSESSSRRQHFWGLLAESPSAFGRHGNDFVLKRARYLTRRSNHVAAVSSRGLNVELALTPLPGDKSGTIFIAVLDCDMQQDETSHVLTPAIILQKTTWHSDTEFVRIRTDYLLMLAMNRIMLPENGSLYRIDHARLSEAKPRQLFIPHNLSARRSPRGILFHPEVAALYPKDPSLVINVLSQTSEWLYHDESRSNSRITNAYAADQSARGPTDEASPSLRAESYVLNFEHTSDLGVTEPTEATILGSLELKISEAGGWNSWHVCLIIGLEPLPPNSLGTPSLYTVPWYAFEKKTKVAAGELDDVLLKENRLKEHKLASEVLKVEFDLESQYSRLFYSVVLKLARLK
ncbi:hypothetical protein ACHAQJ_006339 [Trichoderma viride]